MCQIQQKSSEIMKISELYEMVGTTGFEPVTPTV